MNDLIEMDIQGGRYLDAEKKIGDIILSNPSADSYFMLGTTKSNLLLDKGRSYLEVQFCFDKYLNLSEDKSQAEKNIMAFCVGLYSQLSELENKLIEQKRKEALDVYLGAIVTFVSSKIIDSSKQSFGVISGIVGASFGIGMTLDSLSNIGNLSTIISYVIRLKVEMVEYLKNTIVEEVELLKSEILTLGGKYGTIAQTDSTIDISSMENILGSNYVSNIQTIALMRVKERYAGSSSWMVKNGIFKAESPFEVPDDESVLFGMTSNLTPNLLEYVFTTKGVYHWMAPKLMKYNEVNFKITLLNFIGHSNLKGLQQKIENQLEKVDSLNKFISKMKTN